MRYVAVVLSFLAAAVMAGQSSQVIKATAPLVLTSGTMSCLSVSGSRAGCLSASDWTTFNSKQAAGSYVTALTGEVTASGPGSVTATLTNSAVIGKLLTGFSSGAGTVASTDTILQAFNKVVGNMSLLAPLASPTFTGVVTTPAVNVSGATASTVAVFDASKNLVSLPNGSETQVLTIVSGVPAFAASAGGGGITALTGQVTASGTGSVVATVVNSAVIAKVLTGFSASAGVVAASDTILQGFNKVVGNIALLAPLDAPTFSGTVTVGSGGSLLFSGGGYIGDVSVPTRPGAVYVGSAGVVSPKVDTQTLLSSAGYTNVATSFLDGVGDAVYIGGQESLYNQPFKGGLFGSGGVDIGAVVGGWVAPLYALTFTGTGKVLGARTDGGFDIGTSSAGRPDNVYVKTKTVTPTLYVTTSSTPASASAACTQGQITWDSSFTYVCIATNTWKRSALSTW